MFSGIVEELGSVSQMVRRGNGAVLGIRAAKVIDGTKIGDSIAVDGCCLTVVKSEAAKLSFEVIKETLKSTVIGALRIADKVNLERSLEVGQRISGHFVTGHIDCTGIIRRKSIRGNNACVEIAVPPAFSNYLLPKGSIAVDGISLTLGDRRANVFTVYIIPHTLKNTTLNFKTTADTVNIEFDILAKAHRAALPR